jgi:RNA polymerase sigma-70 factor (ECF subfamily)
LLEVVREIPRPTDAATAPDELLERARGGDRESQGRLLRRHARLVERALRRLVGPTPDLEDLAQEVFLEALRGLPRFRGDARFETWLHRICTHVACHWLRRPRRRYPTLELVETDLPASSATAPESVDARAAFARAHEVLDRLTPVKRVAFLLHVALGHSTREVAALMGSTHTTAKARIWFARRELDAMARSDEVLAAWVTATGDGEGR